MDYIDVNTGFGGFVPGERTLTTAEELLQNLTYVGIRRALVRTLPFEHEDDVEHCNELLFEECGKHPELIPCPMVLPGVLDEFGGVSGQIESALKHHSAAVFLRPPYDGWLPEPWVCEELMGALGEVRLPAYFSATCVKMDTLAKLAGAFPETRFIYSDVNYREMRTLVPMMKHFQNIYLTLGRTFNFHQGLEIFDRTFGSDRLLFGTGMPKNEPGGAMGYLIYSGLSEEKKQAIASGNFERLMKEIKK